MRVLIKHTTLNGHPLEDEGEHFTGETALEVVQAMKGATPFSDQQTVEEYIDGVLNNIESYGGIKLTVRGKTPEELAISFLDTLITHGLAEYADPPDPRIPITAAVWQGLEAVRQSGLTNMLDRPMVARIAEEMGFDEASEWVKGHRAEYAKGIFQGFVVESEAHKSSDAKVAP